MNVPGQCKVLPMKLQRWHLYPLCWCCSPGLWTDGSTQGSHTKLILTEFPVRSMPEFPMSSTGAGSAVGNSSLWQGCCWSPVQLSNTCAFIPEERGEFQRLAHSHCRMVTTNDFVSELRLCLRGGNQVAFCYGPVLPGSAVGGQISTHEMAIRYQQYKSLISLYTFALDNNWKSLPVLETPFLFLAVEQT